MSFTTIADVTYINETHFNSDELKKFKSHHKLVLLALANFSNQDNQMWPSHNTIAKFSLLHRTTVIKVINDLVELGLITKQNRSTENKRKTSNLYSMDIEKWFEQRGFDTKGRLIKQQTTVQITSSSQRHTLVADDYIPSSPQLHNTIKDTISKNTIDIYNKQNHSKPNFVTNKDILPILEKFESQEYTAMQHLTTSEYATLFNARQSQAVSVANQTKLTQLFNTH